jgi:hypothetical protein
MDPACGDSVIEAGAVVTRTEGLMSAPVDDDVVFLNPSTDSYIALDRIGHRIWDLLESPRRFEDLVAALAAEFDADVSVVVADVTAFLDELEREGMVSAVRAPPAQ